MTATKDDLYHVGLTDDEVRKSRTEHGVNPVSYTHLRAHET